MGPNTSPKPYSIETGRAGKFGGVRLQSTAVEDTQGSTAWFCKTLEATPEDKIHWKPMDLGRSMADMAIEVESIIRFSTDKLNGEEKGDLHSYFPAPEEVQKMSRDQIVGALKKSTDDLCKAIDAVPDDRLPTTIELMPTWTETVGLFLFLNAGHISYHNGQANYIQTLYGDNEMRM